MQAQPSLSCSWCSFPSSAALLWFSWPGSPWIVTMRIGIQDEDPLEIGMGWFCLPPHRDDRGRISVFTDAQTTSTSTLPAKHHTVLIVTELSVHLIPLSLRQSPSDSSVSHCEHSHAPNLTSSSCYIPSFTGIWS